MSLERPLNNQEKSDSKTDLITDLKGLNRQKIVDAITQDGSELGILPELANIKPKLDIHTFTSLPSTSTRLWEMLRTGKATPGTAVIAQHQSAGRGQRGRTWLSSAGGLYLSLALEPNWSVTHSAQLTCLSAWGITTALNNLGIAANIKWPNDILYKGKKLGGILTETKLSQSSLSQRPEQHSPKQPSAATITQAVIGVGINWHNPVPETGISLVNILEKNKSLKVVKNKINCLEVLIALVLRGILQGVIFQHQVGSQVFMKAYQKLLTQVGQTVSLDGSGKLSLASPTAQIAKGIQERTPQYVQRNTQCNAQWANRSGEVTGVSEEGYLEVALHRTPHRSNDYSDHLPDHPLDKQIDNHSADSQVEILRLKPSEIHIS